MATYGHEGGGAFNGDQNGGHWRTFRTRCDPEANGRKPQFGDTRWTAILPLEDGSFLKIYMGKKGRGTLFGMLIADCADSGEDEPDPQPEARADLWRCGFLGRQRGGMDCRPSGYPLMKYDTRTTIHRNRGTSFGWAVVALAQEHLRLKAAVRITHRALLHTVSEVGEAYNTIYEVLGEPPCPR